MGWVSAGRCTHPLHRCIPGEARDVELMTVGQTSKYGWLGMRFVRLTRVVGGRAHHVTVMLNEAWGQILREALESLRPGAFAVVDVVPVDLVDAPYAQAALEPSGWYLEVVSDWYLPRDVWPIDDLALKRAGWVPPSVDGDNWYRYEDAQTDVGVLSQLMLDALILGRRCDAGGPFQVTTGRFPTGPGGGEPLPTPMLALAA